MKLYKRILIGLIPTLGTFLMYDISYLVGLPSQLIPPLPVLMIDVAFVFYIVSFSYCISSINE